MALMPVSMAGSMGAATATSVSGAGPTDHLWPAGGCRVDRPHRQGPFRHQQVSSIQEVHRIPGGMRKGPAVWRGFSYA